MKKDIINWEHRRKFELRCTLAKVDEHIRDLFLLAPTRVLSARELSTLESLKICKEKILELEATTWRLKSRVV